MTEHRRVEPGPVVTPEPDLHISTRQPAGLIEALQQNRRVCVRAAKLDNQLFAVCRSLNDLGGADCFGIVHPAAVRIEGYGTLLDLIIYPDR